MPAKQRIFWCIFKFEYGNDNVLRFWWIARVSRSTESTSYLVRGRKFGVLNCCYYLITSILLSSLLLMSEHLRPDLILNLCVVKKKIQVCIINLKHGAKTFCCWTISASNNSLWRHSSESSITMKNCVEKYFLVSLDVKSYLWL